MKSQQDAGQTHPNPLQTPGRALPRYQPGSGRRTARNCSLQTGCEQGQAEEQGLCNARPGASGLTHPRNGNRQLLLQRGRAPMAGWIKPPLRKARGCAAGADLLGLGAAGSTGMDGWRPRDGPKTPWGMLTMDRGWSRVPAPLCLPTAGFPWSQALLNSRPRPVRKMRRTTASPPKCGHPEAMPTQPKQ